MSNDSLPAEGEVFDFSGDGAEAKDVVATIVGFDVVDKDGDAQKVRHVITFGGDDLPFEIKASEWSVYTPNPQAQGIGRSNLKKIAKAATGEPRYSASTLVGTKVLARMQEDKDGFLKLSRFRPVQNEASLG